MYTPALQRLIEHEIQLEFQAVYTYRAFGAFFSHPQMAFRGFAKYFREESNDELKHADAFIHYHQSRGGFVPYEGINKVENVITPLNALKIAHSMEIAVRDNIVKISELADPQTQTFIEDYLKIQTDSIAEYTMLITKTARVENDPTGLYLLDLELQK